MGLFDKFKKKKKHLNNLEKRINKESDKVEIVIDPLEIAKINKIESNKIREKHQQELNELKLKNNELDINRFEKEKIKNTENSQKENHNVGIVCPKCKNKPKECECQKELGDPLVDEVVRMIESQKSVPPPKPIQSDKCAYALCREKNLNYLNSKNCKLCGKLVCLEHVQPENHDCVKHIYVKFLRKDWLRKYGLNVSGGKYKVVCDNCGYQSGFSLIESAGEERTNHIETHGCDGNSVFLEGA